MKISVVMCTFNGQRFLREQLSSIANQTKMPDELIISDDCSTDATWQILEDFCTECPIDTKVLRQKRNRGLVSNYESALRHADGDIVFLCDQDDVWTEDKVERVSNLFAEQPDLGMVFTNAELVDERLNPLSKSLWDVLPMDGNKWREFDQEPFAYLLTKQNTVTGAASAFSKKVIKKGLPFPSQMATLQDAWLGLVAASISEIKSDPKQTLKYRQHPAQMVGTRGDRTETGRRHYQAHVTELITLRQRIANVVTDKKLKLLDAYINHLNVRLNLSHEPVTRFVSVLEEASSGRYWQFSNGTRSIFKDILHGV